MASIFAASSSLAARFRSQASRVDNGAAAADQHRHPQLLPTKHVQLEADNPPYDNMKHLHLWHDKHLNKVRDMLYLPNNPSDSLLMIDSLQTLGIDYHFTEEIKACLEPLDGKYYQSVVGENFNFREAALSFRLLRQAQIPVSSDIIKGFLDRKGELKLSLQRDTRGLLHLYEASFLNTGEELLYKVNELCRKHLTFSMPHLEDDLAWQVQEALNHPYHVTLPKYKARRYLNHLKATGQRTFLQELARADFSLAQSLHKTELQQVVRWWRNIDLAHESKYAQNQNLKWYIWSLAASTDPKFSKYRIEITKVIAFIYYMDDIFDVYGSLDELILFTDAINKWDLSAAASLPSYMRNLYIALYKTIEDIAQLIFEKHGWNPIDYLKRSWINLCNTCLGQAKWFNNNHVPSADEYLRNGIISTGVPTLSLHTYFLIGEVTQKEVEKVIMDHEKLASCLAKILRLSDDLYAEEDDEQEGHDGSYLKCLILENSCCSIESAKDIVMCMITDAWEELNSECFSKKFSESFTTAILNYARMIKVMYAYNDEAKRLVFEDYINSLLFESL